MTYHERKAYKKQLMIIRNIFCNEINIIKKNIKKLSIKYPGKILSVNDIQSLG